MLLALGRAVPVADAAVAAASAALVVVLAGGITALLLRRRMPATQSRHEPLPPGLADLSRRLAEQHRETAGLAGKRRSDE